LDRRVEAILAADEQTAFRINAHVGNAAHVCWIKGINVNDNEHVAELNDVWDDHIPICTRDHIDEHGAVLIQI
jgi:hypothetical protein